jgi:ELWxxDGT repeat protein
MAAFFLIAVLLGGSGASFAAMTAPLPARPATVIDINRFGAGSSFSAFTPFQGRLYFLRSNVGVELWRSDGTAAGTTLVKTLNAAQSFTRSGLRLFAAAAQLFIVIDDYSLGGELWAGDGTEAGTRMLLPLPRNKYFLPPMATLGNRLFFPHYDEPSGQELWVSDGTVAGTQRVADINPGDASSFPQYLTRAGDHLYFAADNGTHATTLWLSDGTDVGTRRVDADAPGTIPPSPSHLMPVGDWLYFGAYDLQAGTELWVVALHDLGLPVNRLYLPIAHRR